MQQQAHEECAAFVGIDWAKSTQAVCLQAADSAKRAGFLLTHTPEAIDAWVRTLRARFNGPPMAICLARTTGPLVSALRKDDFLTLFPINPLTLARYRDAFTPRRATDDPTDAALQLALLLPHRDTLQPLHPQSPAPRARRSTLETCFRDHHVRAPDVIDKRLQAINTARPLTTHAGVIAPNILFVQALVSPRRVTLHALEDCDRALAQRAQSQPDVPLFQALPGAGPVVAPRLLVAFGAQRERSASAAALQQSAGMAPVTERRGKQSWVHWRLQCPKCLRHTFVEWAAESLQHAFWARGYSQPHRDKGQAHQAAVRALAFTWLRILSRCWQDRTPYDASTSLHALNRRGSSLLQNLAHGT